MDAPRKWVIGVVLSTGVFFVLAAWVLWSGRNAPPEEPAAADTIIQPSNLVQATPRKAPRRLAPETNVTAVTEATSQMTSPPPVLPAAWELRRQKRLYALRSSENRQLYADYFKMAALPPVQQEQIVAALTESEMQFATLLKVGLSNPENVSPPSPEALRQHELELNRKLSEIVGENNSQTLETYRRSIPERMLVQDLNRESVDRPLTPEQKQQLLQIYEEERTRIFNPQAPPNMEGLSPEQTAAVFTANLQKINQAVQQRAQLILTPDQAQILARLQEKSWK